MTEVSRRLNESRKYVALLLGIDANPSEFLARTLEGALRTDDVWSDYLDLPGTREILRDMVDEVWHQYRAGVVDGANYVDAVETDALVTLSATAEQVEDVMEQFDEDLEAAGRNEDFRVARDDHLAAAENLADHNRKRRRYQQYVAADLQEQLVLNMDDNNGALAGYEPMTAPLAVYRGITGYVP